MAIGRSNFVSNTYMKRFYRINCFRKFNTVRFFFSVACFVVVFAINVAGESFDYFFSMLLPEKFPWPFLYISSRVNDRFS